ncbi:hypothetical protein ACX3T3_05495 [Actinotignum schaalii]|uniref:hypothetical protein n=1 Tax=Actinotignum TaxID=1653174 RepID=UPI00237D3588|nr:hypothetical protein [Actinotignum sanguinis]MDE1552224.1 hypothetical protein [Actinotignum sanguinis]
MVATIVDVETRLGRGLVDGEVGQVNAWLADVAALITSRHPDYTTRVAREIAVMVECNAVIRKLNNPEGKQNERIDDYSYGLSSDAARTDIFLTEDEWRLLAPRARTGAFTINPATFPEPHGVWLDSMTPGGARG